MGIAAVAWKLKNWDRGETSQSLSSHTTGHTGPYHGGSTGLTLVSGYRSKETPMSNKTAPVNDMLNAGERLLCQPGVRTSSNLDELIKL